MTVVSNINSWQEGTKKHFSKGHCFKAIKHIRISLEKNNNTCTDNRKSVSSVAATVLDTTHKRNININSKRDNMGDIVYKL